MAAKGQPHFVPRTGRIPLRRRTRSLLLAFTTIASAAVNGQQAWAQVRQEQSTGRDVEGSRDHPLLSRFPGAVIRAYDHKEFDSFNLPLGRATGNNAFADTRTIEGKTTWIAYQIPLERSSLEVFRSYQNALSEADFDILWQCETERECGNWFSHAYIYNLEPLVFSGEVVDEKTERYLAAHRAGPAGEQWVALFVYPSYLKDFNIARLRIVETEPMEEGLVTVDAATMAREIDESGHVALYGIHFATNSSTIEPASEATLAEIGRFLANDPDLEVFVVGHTDNTGGFDHNMRLSQERAQAVVEALTSRHGVDAGRLQPVGVGPVAPVASNQTEDGRAKNRRVEIVSR